MKGGVISLGSTSSHWIVEAMQDYFEEVDHVQLKHLAVHLTKGGAEILDNEGRLEPFDCLYQRGSFRYMTPLIAISTALWDRCYLPLEPRSFTLGHDKFLTHLALLKRNVPMPKTFIVPRISTAKRVLKDAHYPIIMKVPYGTQGKGVMFAESYAAAASTLDMIDPLDQPLLIQEYIETDSTDIRALVFGDKVVASMKRVATKDEKRANIHQGGTGQKYSLTNKAKKIAIRSSEAIGADICAVDMLETPLGPVVIEVNLSPGLQGITKATGDDIANKMARFLYKKTKQFHKNKNHSKASELIDELEIAGQSSLKQIVISAKMRGERMMLPEVITSMSRIKDQEELVAEVADGEIVLKRL